VCVFVSITVNTYIVYTRNLVSREPYSTHMIAHAYIHCDDLSVINPLAHAFNSLRIHINNLRSWRSIFFCWCDYIIHIMVAPRLQNIKILRPLRLSVVVLAWWSSCLTSSRYLLLNPHTHNVWISKLLDAECYPSNSTGGSTLKSINLSRSIPSSLIVSTFTPYPFSPQRHQVLPKYTPIPHSRKLSLASLRSERTAWVFCSSSESVHSSSELLNPHISWLAMLVLQLVGKLTLWLSLSAPHHFFSTPQYSFPTVQIHISWWAMLVLYLVGKLTSSVLLSTCLNTHISWCAMIVLYLVGKLTSSVLLSTCSNPHLSWWTMLVLHLVGKLTFLSHSFNST